MTQAKRTSARDRSTAIGGDVGRDVTVIYGEGEPPPPAYEPPAPPDPDTTPDPGPLPPGSHVPFARNANFTGRVEPLKTLARNLLHDEATTLITQAVQGMGGVGKTQLAVEFAHRYGQYFHGAYWINAAQPDAIGAEVAECGAEMAAARGVAWPEKQPEQIAWTLAAWQRGKPQLVVLDNLEEVEAAREWLGRLSGRPIRLLLTARRTDWPSDLGLRSLWLDLFTPVESRDFLCLHLIEEQAASADMDALVQRLGYLPLALLLAGRYLARHRRMTVADYLEELEQVLSHPSMQNWREDLGSPTGHDLDLLATFGVSWERVEDDLAQRLFLVTGYCVPNEPIPCQLLERAAGIDQVVCDEALDLLTGLGLLEMAEGGTPTIHPLLGEYARMLASQTDDWTVLPALVDALAALAHEANTTGSPKQFEPLRSHVEQVASVVEKSDLGSAAVLWDNLGYYLNLIADREKAQQACACALAIAERVHGSDHPEVATYATSLGWVLKDQGNFEGALARFKRALEIDRNAFESSNHVRIARDLRNIGDVLKAQGDLAGAQEHIERALKIDALNDHQVNLAGDANSLGWLLKDQGNLSGARLCFERALEAAEIGLGSDHPDVATYAVNMGLVVKDLGDLDEALDHFRRALEVDRAAFGSNHSRVARDVTNLGWVFKNLSDLREAMRCFEQAVEINENQFGPDSSELASSLNNLGWVLKDLDELEEALTCFGRALRINRATCGPDHVSVGHDLNHIGIVLHDQGKLPDACKAFKQALDVLEGCLPPDDPYIEEVRGHLQAVERAMAASYRQQ